MHTFIDKGSDWPYCKMIGCINRTNQYCKHCDLWICSKCQAKIRNTKEKCIRKDVSKRVCSKNDCHKYT